ncbi:hypothetical protein PVAP13_2KG375856 [Panicum virgatum]|nr:hypothetical protein PVAP13_2KG375856 [Panicum virgatum]
MRPATAPAPPPPSRHARTAASPTPGAETGSSANLSPRSTARSPLRRARGPARAPPSRRARRRGLPCARRADRLVRLPLAALNGATPCDADSARLYASPPRRPICCSSVAHSF